MNAARRALAIALAATAAAGLGRAEDTPKDLGLVDRTEARLAQIDVTVEGPEDAIRALEPGDFEVKVALQKITSFVVDSLCLLEPEREAETGVPATSAASATPPPIPAGRAAAPATFVFYFDQPYLTPEGRQGSIETARGLIPKLITRGARGTILSNATEMHTIVPLTSSVDELLAGLARMEADRKEWDPWASLEENRLAEVARVMDDDVDRAIGIARQYQMDERWRVERDLRRLGMVIGRFASIDPPKAVVYFADAMRSNAGEHYLAFFGETVLDDYPILADGGRVDSLTAALSFDRVVDEAASHGVRFYTVEARGMATPTTLTASRGHPASLSNGPSPTLNVQHIRDAQDTLADLALETGGRSFLNGVQAPRIAGRIERDLSCIYLISFDPRDFPTDRPLSVSVKVRHPRVKAYARGRLVVSSESARLTSRLLATFATPEMEKPDFPLRTGLIPAGYVDGAFVARVQVAVPPMPIVGATWDLGASVVSRGRVREDASGRVRLGTPGAPVVFEKEMRFGSGPYEVVAVAHEDVSDQVASGRLEGSFPDLGAVEAALGPIAVTQTARGAFLRNGETRTSGFVLAGNGDSVQPDRPTAIVGLVCRGEDRKAPLVVERFLMGEDATPVGATEPDLRSEPCAQWLDVIPEGTLGAGTYTYVVRVTGPEGEIARAERRFVAVAPQAAANSP